MMATLQLIADRHALADIRAFVRDQLTTWEITPEITAQLCLAVDEAVTNIVMHGYGGGAGPVDLTIERTDDGIVIRLEDRASPFDPTTVPAPDLSVAPPLRAPGGLGIHLIRTSVDALHHRALPGGGNVLTLIRNLPAHRD